MSTDLMNISAFKGIKPSAAFASLDPNSESLADGIGSSYGIIGYKGKVWSLRLRGETYNFTRPEDGGGMSPAPFLDVIILRQLPAKSKSYYPKDSYVDGQVGTRPLCAALDGITPDADIATPQSTACAICPRNVFKVNAEGRKTRECSDYKRMAVLVLPKLTKDLLGAPLMEPVFLRVPAASLNDLALLGEGMSAQGFHYSAFITRIGFNPEKPHPQMTFRALAPLGDKEGAVVMPLRDDPIALRITGEGEVGRSGTLHLHQKGPPRMEALHPGPTPEQVACALAAAKASQVEADRVAAHETDTGFVLDEAPVTAAVNDTGFDLSPIEAAVRQPAPATAALNTVEDTGAPEESDDDLDARIAAILPK